MPKPEVSAMGQVRPAKRYEWRVEGERYDALRKRMTEATTPTPKPMPLGAGEHMN